LANPTNLGKLRPPNIKLNSSLPTGLSSGSFLSIAWLFIHSRFFLVLMWTATAMIHCLVELHNMRGPAQLKCGKKYKLISEGVNFPLSSVQAIFIFEMRRHKKKQQFLPFSE
jgi:hypothetical protein